MCKKIALVVNPVAGIGGRLGFKGSDGAQLVAKALRAGALKESGPKAVQALKCLQQEVPGVVVATYPGEMGALWCQKAGVKAQVLGAIGTATTPADTERACRELWQTGPELLLFAGGDGTARNVFNALGPKARVLGIPTGCKIHSGVYALNPRAAGEAAAQVLQGQISSFKEAEVMDIDEDLFRQNIVQARLYGYLQIPDASSLVQCSKSGGPLAEPEAVEGAAAYVVEKMLPDTLYIIGTGSTTAAVMQELQLPNTLLGVDLVYNKQLLAADCNEEQVLAALSKYPRAKVVVTVIGGQGYIFGRGNQQLSAVVLRQVGRANIIVMATSQKLAGLAGRCLRVDTGDEAVNKLLCGYLRVLVGYGYEIMMPVKA